MMFLLSLASIVLVGSAFLFFTAGKAKYTFSILEFAGMSLFSGMFIAVFAMFFYSTIGIEYSFWNLASLPVVSVLLLGFRHIAKPYRVDDIVFFKKPVSVICLADKLLFWGIMAQVVWVFFLTLPVPVHSHDAVANYALKAKIFFFSSGIPGSFFSLSESTVAHPDYPLFLPLIMAWSHVFTGFNDVLAKLVMPFLYTGFIAVFFSLMKKIFSFSYALLAAFILATIPQLADYATIAYADLILTAYITIGMLYFLSYVRTGKGFEIFLSAFMIGSSLWIKNEALVFALVFAVVLALFLLRSKDAARRGVFRDVLRALALIIAVALPWFMIKVQNGAVNSDIDIARLTAERLWENIMEIPPLLNLFQQEIFGPKKWNIFWIIFFTGIIWKRKKLFSGEIFYLTVFWALSSFAYFIAYMAMTGENLYFYVNTTISRFMLHFSGVAAILAGYLLYDVVRGEDKQDKYVFVDRDGVINRDGAGWTEHGYVTKWEDFSFLPGVIDGFRALKEAGYKSIVISNQKCVGKGIMTLSALKALTREMIQAVARGGGRIYDVFYCVHRNEDNCFCRKPKEGLFVEAKKKFDIGTFLGRYFIGDSERDIIAGKKAGLKTILVLSGKSSREDALSWEIKPDIISEDFAGAVKTVMEG